MVMINALKLIKRIGQSSPLSTQRCTRATALMAIALFTPLCASSKSIVPENLDNLTLLPLKPTKDQIRTSVNILDQLSYQHYRKMSINDDLSSKLLDGYIKNLDPSRLYFLQSDISEFEAYRYTLDNALNSGNLKLGFAIYNRYQQRLVERLVHIIQLIEKQYEQIKFTQNDTIETNRDEAPWAKSAGELNEIWRKRLKAAALNLELTEKESGEIKSLLLKRFRNNLNRALQNKSGDAFQAYINSLTLLYDPHTQYFSPRNSENFNIKMSLSLEGIGAVLQTENEYTKVVRLVPAGPAEKSGLLKPADKIIGVAQGSGEMIDVIGWRIDEVVNLIRGPKGTEVKLEIISNKKTSSGDTRVISITRDKVKLEEQAAKSERLSVPYKDRNFQIGVIEIPAFYRDFQAQSEQDPDFRSTTRDVTKLITNLKKEGIDGLIIDLRDNGGGSLKEANTLLGLFIKRGPTVQVKDYRGRIELIQDKDPSMLYTGPVAVLVNRLSASASEIFAGAIQDYGRGLVLGSQTFGKGTVQALRALNRGQLKITQAKFYRISGSSNQHQGILPDILFPSLFDESEIGESSLDNALIPDNIRPANYRPIRLTRQVILELTPNLRKNHQQRIKTDPDFQHLLAQIDFNQSIKQQTKFSLNKKTRLARRAEHEAEQLSIENHRRKAKGMPLLKDLEEDDEESEDANQDKSDQPDALLNESANILTDFIRMSAR